MKDFFDLLNEARKIEKLLEQKEGDKFRISFDIKFAGLERDIGVFLIANTFVDIIRHMIENKAFRLDKEGVMPFWWGDNRVDNLKITRKGAREFNVSFDLEFAGSVDEDLGRRGSIKDLVEVELDELFVELPKSREWDHPGLGLPWWSENKISNIKITKIGGIEGSEVAFQERRVRKALKKGKCTQNPDGTWSCKGDVILRKLNLKKLPVKFKEVKGQFDCSRNKLTSLEGAPEYVGTSLFCDNNKLTSLKGAPKWVNYTFDCSYNQLETLEGAPEFVGGRFICDDNPVSEEELKKTIDRDYLQLPEDEKSKIRQKKIISRVLEASKCTQNEDGTWSCEGSVDLRKLNLKELLVKFKRVEKDFKCSHNNLTSLEGAPEYVGGYFDCSHNELTSLEGAPKEVGEHFNCSHNKLTTLEGAPEHVGGFFDCAYNQLETLEGAPEEISGYFYCVINKLTTLEGAPEYVGGNFDCTNNQLTSLEGAPRRVDGHFRCLNNQLRTLEGAPEKVGEDFECNSNKLETLEGAPEEVGGPFSCRSNQLTSLEGAPKRVGGDFICSRNKLTTLEGAPEYVGGAFKCDYNPVPEDELKKTVDRDYLK